MKLDVGDGSSQLDLELARGLDELRCGPEPLGSAKFGPRRLGSCQARREDEHCTYGAHVPETTEDANGCAQLRHDATMILVQGPSSRPKIGFVLSGGGSRGA